MKPAFALRIAAGLVLFAAVLTPTSAQAQPTPRRVGGSSGTAAKAAGFIQTITGQTQWRSSSTAKPITLDPKKDSRRPLRTGEGVRLLTKTSSVTLYLGGRTVTLKNSLSWYPIADSGLAGNDPRAKDLKNYAGIGGIDRGPQPRIIYAPVRDSCVQLPAPDANATITVRYFPRSEKATFVLFGDDTAAPLWQEKGVDLSTGTLPTAAARRLAQIVREAIVAENSASKPVAPRAPNHRFTLCVLLNSSEALAAADDVTNFAVLTAAREAALQHELAALHQPDQPPFVEHLARVALFDRLGLLYDAVAEYDTALAEAPESTYLRFAAAQKHRAIGDYPAADSLDPPPAK